MKMLRLFLFIFSSFITSYVIAQEQPSSPTPSISELLEISAQKNLANSSYWHTLLHINRGATLTGHGKSYIDDENFFINSNGKSSPQAELDSTIKTLFNDPEAQCKYIARWRWLNEQLLGNFSYDSISHCKEFIDWKKTTNADQMVLVFPASYLNSPSSMYGHTLIRLDPPQPENKEARQPSWLSLAVNYGAQTNNEDQSMFYAIKGLGGGYPGLFALQPYFEKIAEYNHNENRDIWEYYLNLTSEEVNLIIEHLWELRDVHFDYYFLDENCSFRLLELIQIAKPDLPLMEDMRLAEIPVNTVRTITDNNLIKDVIYRPSKASTLTQWIDSLDSYEQTLAKTLADSPDNLTALETYSADDKQKAFKIIKTAYLFHQHRSTQSTRTESAAKNNFKLLKLLKKYSEYSTKTPEFNVVEPHKGHKTQTLKLGINAYQLDDDPIITPKLGYRYNYHDLLDNSRGYLKGANLEVFDIDIEKKHQSSDWQLTKMDLINIESLSPRNKFLSPLSWRVNLGYERSQAQDGITFVEGGAGATWKVSSNSIIYALPSLRIENNKAYSNWIRPAAALKSGWLLQTDDWSTQIEYHGHYFNDDSWRQLTSLRTQYHFNANQALRLSLSRYNADTGNTTLGDLQWRFHF